MTVRTRFAPSPTGYLHIGGVRTALFNWLFARHHGGIFILRIEDTDQARSTEEYLNAILASLRWLGLEWDEGPYFQSRRMQLYREHVERLVEAGKAFRCYCTPEELEQRRQQALAAGQKPKYDGRCRERTDHPQDLPSVIRFKAPQAGATTVDDLVKGRVVFENEELDDLIILRSDGTPTYNFVVVVDDALMGITHVVRGDDHLNNTPRQIQLYEALGYPPPAFAHLPLILGPDRARLSKRHGATSITAYQEMGYVPHALVNYLARLGWSSGDQEIFSREELIEKFSLEAAGRSAGIFNPEKLLWLNAHYLKEGDPGQIAQQLIPFLHRRGIKAELNGRLVKVVQSLQPRAKTLAEMAEMAEFYFRDDFPYDEKGSRKFLRAELSPFLTSLLEGLRSSEDFAEANLERFFRQLIEQQGLTLNQAAQGVRIALTGRTTSPGLFEVMEGIGRERVIKRLERALGYIGSQRQGEAMR
ncbi:MAG: glutamate--tRNA ligase [Deltaproteobacteria bacterium RBG_16_54_11]|jgi:glutamyl-tRNA synthetase|nr:MAG: glutamate--tRNA ligase [Deltaproteobacteria bacterium RBG_16_54_11]